MWQILQFIHHLCRSSLDSLLYVHVFFVLENPELDSALQIWSYQCWAKENNHLSSPAGHALSNAAQDALELLVTKAPCWLSAHQDNQVHYCKATFQLVSPWPVPVLGLFLPRCKTWIFICWTSWDSCWPMAASQAPSEQQHNHLGYQLLIPILYLLHTCIFPSSRSLMKMWNGTGYGINPCRIALAIGLYLDFVPLNISLSAQQFVHFPVCIIFNLSSPSVNSLSMPALWETVTKVLLKSK